MKNRILFMGTPDFAVPSLKMLIENGYEVAAVATQPDRPKGRGHKLMPSPVKQYALACGIPVYEFEKISRHAQEVRQIGADIFITAAFGQILSQEILDIPALGCINVHGSLLPKYRGAAPIQWAIINGEKKTGVTTMYTVYELDAGDMLEKLEIEIPPDMTAGELFVQMADLGAQTLKTTLEKLENGTLKRAAQDEAQATYYPMFKKGFGKIDFNTNTQDIINLVRGLNPAPVAYALQGEEKFKVYKASVSDIASDLSAGEVICADAKNGLVVKTADGAIHLDELQMSGKKRMDARDLLRGRKIGDMFD